jgi:4-amino-4-deoxy-L-arabinose transferase-like glycosyltransferase
MRHEAGSLVKETRRTTNAVGIPPRAFVARFLILAVVALAGALLIALLYQVPARHVIDLGGYDAAYSQGFHESQRSSDPGTPPPYLTDSDGSARWTRGSSSILLPQAGLPAEITLRLRGWRPAGQAPPRVSILLNGEQNLGDFQTTGEWETHSFAITGGLLKATDIFVEIRSETAQLPDDGREVGVLLDTATFQVAPSGLTTPYPAQLLYGALAAMLLFLLTQPATRPAADVRKARSYLVLGSGFLVLSVLFLFLYRLQPPLYPYPLRTLLPGLVLLLAAALALRDGPALLARWPVLLRAVLPLTLLLWAGAVLLAAQDHVTLSVPGVEKDFRVFAGRSNQLWGAFQPNGEYTAANDGVFRADGFYNLGYPLLLWLVRPLTENNPFLAARLISAVSGALFLLAGYMLARALLPRPWALLALLLLALSPLVVQYGLYLGTDMPFAALLTLALALLLRATTENPTHNAEAQRRRAAEEKAVEPSVTRHSSLVTRHSSLVFLSGLAAGGAFLVRHLGLVLLLWGVLLLGLVAWRRRQGWGAATWRLLAAYGLGFVLVASPQLIVNTMQTGQPLFNQQAKNVWFAVYGGIDWGRWEQAPDSIPLAEVVLRDPARFVGSWWHNLVGFLGTGGEDTSEFGRAIQLRLLGWPANWLALAGLLAWLGIAAKRLVIGDWRLRQADNTGQCSMLNAQCSMLFFLALYVLAVSMAFALPRFFLPLVPIYALAAAWLVQVMSNELRVTSFRSLVTRYSLLATFILVVVLWGGFGVGRGYVLQNQPADEVAAVRLVAAHVQPGQRLVSELDPRVPLDKYSAMAHMVLPMPPAADMGAALAQARQQGATYLLWDGGQGEPPLASPSSALVGTAGRFGLYRLEGQ